MFIEATPANQLEVMMSRIRAKSLIIWGDTDWVFPSSSAQALQKGIKNSKVIILKDCGHMAMLERPEETARHYLEFIS